MLEEYICSSKTVKIMERGIIWIVCLLCACFVKTNAQTIKGKVTDRSNKPVEYATVILQTTDSTYVGATQTDSLGYFSLHTDSMSYRLIVQHLMYESYENEFSNIETIKIELTEKENVLDEITIKGERPLVRLIDGKLTYDVPSLISGKVVNSAYDAILQLPGIREQDGSLVLAGAGNVIIIINGQLVSIPQENLMAALKMYSAEMVQSAEIMYSTPPQYHVRGSSINIVLRSNESNNELQALINTGYNQKYYSNYMTGVSLLYSFARLSSDIYYGFNSIQDRTGVDIFSNHLIDNTTHYIEQFNNGYKKTKKHDIRLGLKYKLSGEDIINFSYIGQISPKFDAVERSTGSISNSNNTKSEDSPIQLHNLSIGYSSGFGLSLGTEYTFYKDHLNQYFNEEMNGNERNFIANSKQDIGRFRIYADKTHSLKSDWKINYGLQYMYAKDKSSQIYKVTAGNDMSALNVDNKIDEYTANIYTGFDKKIGKKISLSASVSGEYYKIGEFDEWTLFPAIEATYFINQSNIMQFSFSSDKVYPSYWEFHGATGYLNGYAEVHGNPLLKPYKKYSSQLNYLINNKYIITLFYSYMDRYSAQLPYQANDRLILIYKTENFDYKQQLGLNFIIPFKIGEVINSRLTLTGFYDKVKSSKFHDISFEKENLALYPQLTNTINISSRPNIKMEVEGAYVTKNIQGPAELSNMWKLDIGLKWSFFNDMAEFRLKGTDLFNTWSPNMRMKYSNQNLNMNILPDTREISLGFAIKFGGYNEKGKKVDTSRFGVK